MSVEQFDPRTAVVDQSQIKQETLKITVIGLYALKEGEEVPKGISQEFQIHIPPGMPNNDQAAQLVSEAINKNGIVVKRNEYAYDMYPAGSFDRVAIDFGVVTGVTLT